MVVPAPAALLLAAIAPIAASTKRLTAVATAVGSVAVALLAAATTRPGPSGAACTSHAAAHGDIASSATALAAVQPSVCLVLAWISAIAACAAEAALLRRLRRRQARLRRRVVCGGTRPSSTTQRRAWSIGALWLAEGLQVVRACRATWLRGRVVVGLCRLVACRTPSKRFMSTAECTTQTRLGTRLRRAGTPVLAQAATRATVCPIQRCMTEACS
jgi:hypothetical protein